MASLMNLIRRGRASKGPPPAWAGALFDERLVAHLQDREGRVLVWTVANDASKGRITDQFRAGAEEYHRRYAASDHFERLFRKALAEIGLELAPEPLILDLGSGSGVNSIVPLRRIRPGARMIATDLSGELLAMLGDYLVAEGAADQVACVKMDAMSTHVAPGAFDLVTGASILHHLAVPEQGIAAAARALKPGGRAIFFEPFNGWAIMRLAFERILAEAELRGDPLDPAADAVLRATIRDVAERSDPDTTTSWFLNLDDKWLFSREKITDFAATAGFSGAQFVPHAGHKTLYRDMTAVQLRLGSGRDDVTLPDWANAIVDGVDAALTREAKRELMMEGTIVLTK